MPRSLTAQNWKPDATEQHMIDEMAKYLILGEHVSAKLRTLEKSHCEQLYNRISGAFTRDPIKYPSLMALDNDKKGREVFAAKCEAICFPPPSQRSPPTPEDYIMKFLASVAFVQSKMGQDIIDHPFGGEMAYRANLQVLRALGGQPAVESAIAFERDLRDKPMNFLGQTVRCYDKDLRRAIEYTVADCGASALTGDFFVLKDANGSKRHVTGDEFHEMKVD